MLARRFTIVCLVTMLFGMGLSSLVAQSQASSHAHPQYESLCKMKYGMRC